MYNDYVYQLYIVESVSFLENRVYLDNSSTTKPCAASIKAITSALENDWGNPSSLHILGFEAEKLIKTARGAVADVIHASTDEIYFTGSGTAGNNTAILGAAEARKKRGRRIVTTAVEHPSVLEPMRELEARGFEVIYLKPDKSGAVTEGQIKAAVDSNTVLVSIMLVNNETGAIMPIKAAREAIKSAGAPALLHCDAVQAFGKMQINVGALGVDLLTASAHKIHGPKGVGVLYVKKGVTIRPLLLGGGQEKGMRSGTESVPLICGLGGALSELGNINANLEKMRELQNFCREALLGTGLITVNSPDNALPYILNVSVKGYRSETLLHFLEARGVYVASGSACAKGNGCYVLNEMGLERGLVDSALRISFSRYNTKDDILKLRDALVEATTKLRRSN